MKTAIYLSFLFLAVYLLSIYMDWTQVALLFFGLSPAVVLYLVYKVLKDPKAVSVTFEDQFYQKRSHPRTKEN